MHTIRYHSRGGFFALIAFLCVVVLIEVYLRLQTTDSPAPHIIHKPETKETHPKQELQTTLDDSEVSEVSIIVLWWTSFIDGLEYTKNCGNHICRFTGDRKYLKHDKTKVNICYYFYLFSMLQH